MATPLPTPRRFGDYELLALLGRGGMAEVFRARVLAGPREGELLALKRLLPGLADDADSVAQFAREADLSRLLKHPNIVQVLEAGDVQGRGYIAMELVDGRDLGQILRRCQARGIPLPIDFALYLSHMLFEALSHAHTATGERGEPLGVVHCDVSPSNLFISRTGEIKLGDFGVARGLRHGTEGEVLGKPYYVSPEVLEGHIDPLADLWAGTVVLYELLTLQRPFRGTTPEEVFQAARARNYIPVRDLRPDVPPWVEALVALGFHLEPTSRPGTAREFCNALEPLYDPDIGTPLAIAAVVRGLFGVSDPA
ncbi:MAG TPA: serine/threonine-protein kinase [Myxococcaceae bacterium]|nr:serine/threonine-protein kinase [Myxococcaceae bacterium]